MAVESGAVSVLTFVPVDQRNLKKENIVITKSDVRIEFSCHTDIKAITNIEYSANRRPLVTVEKSTQYAEQVHFIKILNTLRSPLLF